MQHKIKILHLSSICNQLDNIHAMETLGRVLKMKKDSYANHYSKTVNYTALPMDKYDFFCDHFAFIIEQNSKQEILSSLRIVTTNQCRAYGESFPGYKLLKDLAAPNNLYQEMDKKIDLSLQNSFDIGCIERWSTNKKLMTLELKKQLREIIMATLCLFQIENNVKYSCAGGVPGLKTDLFMEKMGYKETTSVNLQHSILQYPNKNDVEREKITIESLKMSEKYKKEWDKRAILAPEIMKNSKLKKAS